MRLHLRACCPCAVLAGTTHGQQARRWETGLYTKIIEDMRHFQHFTVFSRHLLYFTVFSHLRHFTVFSQQLRHFAVKNTANVMKNAANALKNTANVVEMP